MTNRMRLSTDGGCALCFGIGVCNGSEGPMVCPACGCRWKKHPPDDVFPSGSLQLYDADQRPCVECCDNTFNPPLRHETPDDAKGDPA